MTDESKERIAALPEGDKFAIYLFDYEEDNSITELAKQYAKVNKNITVEVVDSDKRPDLVQKYNVEEGYGTIIIENGEKSKTFDYYDFSNYDYNTGKSTDVTEQRFTNCLIALSSIRKNNSSICAYRTWRNEHE
ncbi:MAG: thioredoxin [Clostridia bacterium]|nr:thioredoxin [Clostridia bacterium]